MTVSLSSLRVVGEFDASGYARGAAQKVAADAQMIASDKARNTALAQADAAMAKVVPGVSKLSASLLDGYGAGTKFEATVRQIGAAVDRGMGLDRANLLLDAAYKKFGMTADAAKLAEHGYVSIAPAIQAANERFASANNVVNLHSVRLANNAKAATTAAAATGLTSHELKNLGFQANDAATMLLSGSSAFQVFATQGGQVFQILQGANGGVSGALKGIASSAASILTPARMAFGGIVAGAGAALIALNGYLAAQQRVSTSLLGAGRASGASISGINAIGQSASSTTGLSVSEARDFAAELASTGKIGKENLAPIVAIGHDIATVFGVDAAGAAKLLGKAFADPVAGAEQLNARLGFLDAATKRQIENLQAQNRLQDAQRVLQAGVSASLADVSQAVSTSTKFWTVLGNTASNVWDSIGAAASRATGIGLTKGLDEQLQAAQAKLESLQRTNGQIAERYNFAFGMNPARNDTTATKAATEAEAKLREEIDRLSDAMRRNAQAAVDAQQRQMSFIQAGAVRAQLPEIDQTQKLRNDNELLVRTMIDVQVTGGASSEMLKRMGVSYDELGRAVAASTSKVANFKTENEMARAAQATQLKSLTAFSPSAKGDVAFEQRFNAELARGTVEAKARALADGDRVIAIRGVAVALSEAGRARELSSRQFIDSAQLEIDLVGKTISQQVEMRANLQSRQTLEQQASQNRTGFDNAEFQRLKRNNAEAARRTEIAVRAAVNDNVSFGRHTALLSPEDVQIAQQLKGIYPDVATSLASVEAAGLRTNSALSGMSSTMSGSMVTGLSDIADGTKSIAAGADGMKTVFIRALTEMMVKMAIVQPAMRAMQMGMSALGGMMGFSTGGAFGGAGATGATGVGGIGGLYANGQAFGSNVIPFARGGTFTNSIFSEPTLFRFAQGGAMASGVMGEAGPEAVMPLRRGSDGKLGVSMHGGGGGGGGNTSVNVKVVNQTGVAARTETSTGPGGDITVVLKKMVDEAVGESMSTGTGKRVLDKQYGVKPFTGS